MNSNPDKETDLLKLKNYSDHPTVPGVKVFFFRDHEQGNYFETLLIENKIGFEKDVDREEDMIFFGIKRNDFDKTLNLNYLSYSKHREPFIPNPIFRYSLIAFIMLVLVFAMIGYSLSK